MKIPTGYASKTDYIQTLHVNLGIARRLKWVKMVAKYETLLKLT